MLPPEFTLVTIAESLLVKVSSARLKTKLDYLGTFGQNVAAVTPP